MKDTKATDPAMVKTLLIDVPPGLTDWTWSDGSQKLRLPVRSMARCTGVGPLLYAAITNNQSFS